MPRNILNFLELCGSDPQNINGTTSFHCHFSAIVCDGIFVRREELQHSKTL
jgi:hypothetical protein